METFSLEACQRLAEVLGEDAPKAKLWWVFKGQNLYLYNLEEWEVCSNYVGFAKDGHYYPAYRLDDLTQEVWEKIGERMGWPKPCDGKCWCTGECKKTWFAHATNTHQAWLTGGYPEASKYLIDILQGYGKNN